jgi:SAM-dependent methyltransferase
MITVSNEPLLRSFPHLSFRGVGVIAALMMSLVAGCATQHAGTDQYQPLMAQRGKDVMWMPTPNAIVTEMLEMAQVTSIDLVYDLGAGDGKIPIEAARRYGARAVGIEYNPDMAALARRNAQQAGVSDRVTIVTGDIFKEDFSNATVVTLYLLTELNIKLKPTLLKMKPGTRIVSNTFAMGAWTPDEVVLTHGESSGYFWIVPAKVEGKWSVTGLTGFENAQLNIVQKNQKFDAQLALTEKNIQRIEGGLRGSRIHFSYLDAEGKLMRFVGEVGANTIHGSILQQPNSVVTAKRIQ